MCIYRYKDSFDAEFTGFVQKLIGFFPVCIDI